MKADTLTGAVGAVRGRGRQPHAVVGARVAVDRVLGEVVALLAAQHAVHGLLLLHAHKLPVDGDVGLAAVRPCAPQETRPGKDVLF